MNDDEPLPSYAAPTLAAIRNAVCQHYDICERDFLSDRRTKWIAKPRQVAMFLARDLTFQSYPSIGRHFGKRDHTTIMHGERAISDALATDPQLAADVAQLRASLTIGEQLAA